MLTATRQKVISEVRLLMGDQMIDIELDPEHYELALDLALERYRMRAGNSTEESYMFLQLLYETNEYILPDEVVMVRQIFRRGLGATSGGTSLDPFALAYTNLYLLQAGSGGGYSAGLLTYELYNDFLKQAGKMFGANINFSFDVVTKKLKIVRKPMAPSESVLLWVQTGKSDDHLISDPFVKPWIRNYTLAKCKSMLGAAYSKQSTYVGPQGGVQLNGAALIQEADALIEKLEREIDLYMDNSAPPGITIG